MKRLVLFGKAFPPFPNSSLVPKKPYNFYPPFSFGETGSSSSPTLQHLTSYPWRRLRAWHLFLGTFQSLWMCCCCPEFPWESLGELAPLLLSSHSPCEKIQQESSADSSHAWEPREPTGPTASSSNIPPVPSFAASGSPSTHTPEVFFALDNFGQQ